MELQLPFIEGMYAGLFFGLPALVAMASLLAVACLALVLALLGLAGFAVPTSGATAALALVLAWLLGRVRRPVRGIVPLDALARPDGAKHGGDKAARLAVAAARWPVPPALVLTGRFLAEGLNEREAKALRRALRPLAGQRLVVRSSFAGEDAGGRGLAGVFNSVGPVEPGEVPAAVEAVLASATGPSARAWGADGGALSVIVQRWQSGTKGFAASADLVTGRRDRVRVQAGHVEVAVDLADPAALARSTGLSAAAATAILDLLEGLPGDVEIEWVADGDAVWLVQVRPLAFEATQTWSQGRWGVAPRGPLSPLSQSLLLAGLAWEDELRARLLRLGSPDAGRLVRVEQGRWFLRDDALLRARRAGATARGQLGLLRIGLGALRPLAHAREDDLPGLAQAMRVAMRVDHDAAFAADTVVRSAALRGLDVAPDAAAAGSRRAQLSAASDLPEAELRARFADLSAWPEELASPRLGEGGPLPGPTPTAPARSGLLAALARFFARRRERARDRLDALSAAVRSQALRFGETSGLGDDVFLLDWAELLGGAVPEAEDLDRRRAHLEACRDAEVPEVLAERDGGLHPADPGDSRGLVPGVAEGAVAGPENAYPGCVLLLPDDSPAWAALLPGVAALLLPRGGALSHLAMLARGAGIPCVLLGADPPQPGERVRVDGSTGELRRV